MASEPFECILLIENSKARNTRRNTRRNFALAHSEIVGHSALEVLSSEEFQVVSCSRLNLPASKSYKLIDSALSVTVVDSCEVIRLFVDEYNLDFVKELFQSLLLSNRLTLSKGIPKEARPAMHDERDFRAFEKFTTSQKIQFSHPNGGSLLHYAVVKEDKDFAGFLLDHKACPNSKGTNDATPLHLCLEWPLDWRYFMVLEFLDAGASVNVKMSDGSTPLVLAVRHKNASLGIVKTLVENGADLEVKVNGFTPFLIAVDKGHESIVQYLLEQGVNVNCKVEGSRDHHTEGMYPIHLAILDCSEWLNSSKILRSLNMFKLLVENGADLGVKIDGFTPLHTAVDRGNLSIINYLLQKGVDVNCSVEGSRDPAIEGACPIHLAIKKIGECEMSREIVGVLLSSGSDINALCNNGLSPLYFAVDNIDKGIFKKIIARRPDVNNAGNKKAFRFALKKENLRNIFGQYVSDHTIIQRLFDCGFDLETEDANDVDLLFAAIYHNRLPVVEKLISLGANVHVSQSQTWMARQPPMSLLNAAAKFSDNEILKRLLDLGADPNAKYGPPGSERTPLMDVVERCRSSMVETLLAYHADPRAEPSQLVYALERWLSCDIVEPLIKNGADLFAKNKHQRTPLAIVIGGGRTNILELLVRYGVEVSLSDLTHVTHRGPDFLRNVLKYVFRKLYPSDETVLQEVFEVLGNAGDLADGEEYFSESDDLSCEFSESDEIHIIDYVKIFAHHILKIDAVFQSRIARGLIPIGLYNSAGIDSYERKCETELNKLRSIKIGETDITFFDVLERGVDGVCRFARNEDFVESLEYHDTKRRFPIYGAIVDCHYRQGMVRRKSSVAGMKMMRWLFPAFVKLPDELKERIVNFLSNQDIAVLQLVIKLK